MVLPWFLADVSYDVWPRPAAGLFSREPVCDLMDGKYTAIERDIGVTSESDRHWEMDAAPGVELVSAVE